jgi:catechol 2,3-dioxygenase-like lactoylglutathione lyase family enzyme
MTTISHLTIEVDDSAAADRFYESAFALGDRIRTRVSATPTSGFRGFTLSLTVSQPSTVSEIVNAAVGAGGIAVKPVAKSMWGIGGTVQAPDGTIWTIATSAKKDSGPATRAVDQIVLLVGAEDVAASKRFYLDRGLTVAKSFGKYVEFAMPAGSIGFGLYARRALAKTAGIQPEGSGSHRLEVGSDAGTFSDPDGFTWVQA